VHANIVKPPWLLEVLRTGRLLPFDFVVSARTEVGTDIPSFLSCVLEKMSKKPDLTMNPDFDCFLKGILVSLSSRH